MRQVLYYKMRQLLQITTTLLQNATDITYCERTSVNFFNCFFKANKIEGKSQITQFYHSFLATFITFPTLVYMQFLNRYYSTFAEGPQCKYKQFDACIVLYCHQQKCCIFVNIDEYYLLTFFCYDFNFNLVFNNFHIFFGKY